MFHCNIPLKFAKNVPLISFHFHLSCDFGTTHVFSRFEAPVAFLLDVQTRTERGYWENTTYTTCSPTEFQGE